MKTLAVFMTLLALPGHAQGAIFHATSSSLSGPGSLLEAVQQANSTPGTDTIQFDPGLRIDLTSDDDAFRRGVVHLTESANPFSPALRTAL